MSKDSKKKTLRQTYHSQTTVDKRLTAEQELAVNDLRDHEISSIRSKTRWLTAGLALFGGLIRAIATDGDSGMKASAAVGGAARGASDGFIAGASYEDGYRLGHEVAVLRAQGADVPDRNPTLNATKTLMKFGAGIGAVIGATIGGITTGGAAIAIGFGAGLVLGALITPVIALPFLIAGYFGNRNGKRDGKEHVMEVKLEQQVNTPQINRSQEVSNVVSHTPSQTQQVANDNQLINDPERLEALRYNWAVEMQKRAAQQAQAQQSGKVG